MQQNFLEVNRNKTETVPLGNKDTWMQFSCYLESRALKTSTYMKNHYVIISGGFAILGLKVNMDMRPSALSAFV